MQSYLSSGWESQFVHGLRNHLAIVIPVSTLAVKILIRMFSRDEVREVLRTFTNVPLELLLIAMSFMFGALSGISENYVKHFDNQSDADLFAATTIVLIFLIAIGVNKLSNFARTLGGKLFVAYNQYRKLTSQPQIEGTVEIGIGGRLVWATVYCTLLVIVLLFAFGISAGSLAYVLHLIQ